jgi:hypothetical protein
MCVFCVWVKFYPNQRRRGADKQCRYEGLYLHCFSGEQGIRAAVVLIPSVDIRSLMGVVETSTKLNFNSSR